MRYITDSNGYVLEVSFGADVVCNGKTCTEYTGAVPSGYSSLAHWFTENGEHLYRWKITGGQLTLDSSVPVKSAACAMSAPLHQITIEANQTVSFMFPYTQTCALVTARGWSSFLRSSFLFSGYGPGESRANICHLEGSDAVQVSVNKGSTAGHGFSVKAVNSALHVGVIVLVGGPPTIEMTEENALSLATLTAHPISNGGTGATDAATALANLGGMSMTKLYENASPTSSFARQNVTIAGAGYNKFLVEFKNYSTGASYSHCYLSTFAIKGFNMVVSPGEEGNYIVFRHFNITDTYVAFEPAHYATTYAGALAESTDCLVPYRIYGIKGA